MSAAHPPPCAPASPAAPTPICPTGVTAVTLSADDPTNTPDEASSQWTIAAKPGPGQKVTYTTSWNADGDGADVYKPFKATGMLGNTPIDASASAGAIVVTVTLQPGQVATVPFVLAWDFPQITYGNNQTVWMRRYTDFYGAQETSTNDYVGGSYPFHQGYHIADDALASHDANLDAVTAWYLPLLADTAYPELLRTAALNQLYQVAFKMPLWEGGLVGNTVAPTLGQRLGTSLPGTHLFFEMDSAAGGNTNMGWDVGSYGYLAYDTFFPTIERDRLRGLAQAIMLDPYGDPDTGAGTNPYISWTESSAPVPGTTEFIDVPSKKIYRMYAYAVINDDYSFLQSVYPAMKKELAFIQGVIAPGQNLPEAPTIPQGYIYPVFPNTYDVIPTIGRDAYDSQLYVLALEVMIASGKITGERPEILAKWETAAAAAKAEFESVFWDPTNNWYRYTEYTTGSAVHLDTLFAQHVAERFGLPRPARYQPLRETARPIQQVHVCTRRRRRPADRRLQHGAAERRDHLANPAGPVRRHRTAPGNRCLGRHQRLRKRRVLRRRDALQSARPATPGPAHGFSGGKASMASRGERLHVRYP